MANTLTSSQADGNTSKRGRLLLVLGVVLVAALGAGAFFWATS